MKAISGGIVFGATESANFKGINSSFPISGSATTLAASNPNGWRVTLGASTTANATLWVACVT